MIKMIPADEHDRRVAELLAANSALVERARLAEKRVARLLAVIFAGAPTAVKEEVAAEIELDQRMGQSWT